MIMARIVSIACDNWDTPAKCFATIETNETSVREARKVAGKRGWRRRNGRDLCPRCAAIETQAVGA